MEGLEDKAECGDDSGVPLCDDCRSRAIFRKVHGTGQRELGGCILVEVGFCTHTLNILAFLEFGFAQTNLHSYTQHFENDRQQSLATGRKTFWRRD